MIAAFPDNETWMTIPNYDDYEVSNHGRVKSHKSKEPLLMKQYEDSFGYPYVGLRKNNKLKFIKIHQLVAMAFLGHVPNGNTIVVDHIDENRKNNHLSNLRLLSSRDNTIRKKYKKGSSKYVGVSWVKRDKKWSARIYVNGFYESLGYYDCEEQAHKKYQERLKEIKNDSLIS